MVKFLSISLAFIVLFACGDDEKAVEVVKLTTFKDKLSYILGAEQSRMVTESKDPNLDRLDYNAIIEGFKKGIKNPGSMSQDCYETVQALYGPNGQDFDTTYLTKGCDCIGLSIGSAFIQKWTQMEGVDKVDLDKAVIGFQHGLERRDTLIVRADRDEIFGNFVNDLNKVFIDRNKALENEMLSIAKALPNAKVLPNGVVVEVIQEGKGGMPSSDSDVKADYILTNAKGDTLESSFQYKVQRGGETPAFNLRGVIPGWTQTFPSLKKGGKYRLFIPGELAYGAQSNFEPLCFYIDFIDFGVAGSIVKPQPETPYGR
jgi:FKBP-type peptidyl-prolyl cis-trans isomerase FkpA